MSFLAALLMPLALSAPIPAAPMPAAPHPPAAMTAGSLPAHDQPRSGQGQARSDAPRAVPDDADGPVGDGRLHGPFSLLATAFREVSARQVRIERHTTIRISPRSAPMPAPNMLMDLPGGEIGPRFAERKIGKCLSAGDIAGVQASGGNRLILFLRDRRVISAELERACRSRDFYSGFYLSRSEDGKLCVDRDTLLSRSGANCKLSRIRQLVEIDN